MCGITGYFDYGTPRPTAPEVLDAMVTTIYHRGPDDGGTFVDGGVGLGVRRLSIIDVEGGHQPMTNADGRVTVVFNGEIYNYRELRQWLIGRGYRLRTNADTEVIPHLYEELGDDFVHRLRGMFGLALYDRARGRLLLVRDRIGIKPLYYRDDGRRVVFGSEIKAMLAHPDVEASPDLTAVSQFLSLKYAPAPRTFFAGIKALPPGHLMTVDHTGVNVKRYWDVSFARDGAAHDDAWYGDRLRKMLRDAMSVHLRSDVPFGAFLSGGVDSSLVVALMTEMLDEPVRTFSIGFRSGNDVYGELPYARLVAQHFRTDHHEIMLDAHDFVAMAPRAVWHLDQPIADEAVVPTLALSELAASKVKMVLGGEGGDELFAGYARYPGERFGPVAQRVPAPVKHALLRLADRVPGRDRPKIALYALAQPTAVERMVNWFPLFNADMKAHLLASTFGGNGESPSDVFSAALHDTDASDPLHRMLYVDTKLWLVDDLLARGDKMAMAASLEMRVPLLDHELVEFVAAMPARMKLRGLQRKYLLKKVAGPLLPPEILARKKEGFPVPVGRWFRDEARDFVHDLLADSVVRRRGWFEPAAVRALLVEHDTQRADRTSMLWALAQLELWLQAFVD
jgi:asparagine synthase (glutamine-hydrolysing)